MDRRERNRFRLDFGERSYQSLRGVPQEEGVPLRGGDSLDGVDGGGRGARWDVHVDKAIHVPPCPLYDHSVANLLV